MEDRYNVYYKDDNNHKHVSYNVSRRDTELLEERYEVTKIVLAKTYHWCSGNISAFQADVTGSNPV